jgi:polysaccharide chain length determinant protein (PEP-CTERM system associated)
MREALEQLNSQLWIILHHRWLALICAFVICAAGWAVVNILPDQYRVEAKFFFDTKTVLKPLLEGLAVDSSVKEESISLIKRTLTSRPNLVKVAQDTELDLTATTPKETEALLKRLENSISISAVSDSGNKRGGDDIYSISYVSTDPVIAKKVVDSLLNIFVESLLGITRKDSDKAEAFLDEKIREYRQKLEEAENNIKVFKQNNAGLLPEEGSSFYSRLYAAEAKLDEAMLRLREERNKNASLQEQLTALENQSDDAPAELMVGPPREKTQLEKRIEAMKLKLDELELQYTDRHPDVITTRKALEELMAQQEAEAAAQTDDPDADSRMESASPSIRDSNFYQELKIMLSSSNSEIAAITARIDDYRNRIEEMKALVNVMPEVEAKMKSLVRNYEILKETYDNLVQRRASAQISREAEQTGSEFQFNIIEPPRVPLEPVSPNRLLLASLVLLAGVFGGAALAWVYEQLKPTYYQQQEIEEDFELPVYGGVSMFWSPQEISRRKAGISIFILLYLVLFSAWGLLLFHYGLGEKLPDQVMELLGL